jgi:cyanophycinase
MRLGDTQQRAGMMFGLTLAVCVGLLPTGATAQQVGPESGSLVIVGGAMQSPEIVRAFIDRAGGPDAPIVVIPTAGGADDEAYGPWCGCARQLRENGARNVVVLHTYDPGVADTEGFVDPLLEARGVWFPGGRQWRLADAYLGTRTERALQGVLDRGGVIGGSSAGASIQGSYLARGDTRSNTVMMGDHEVGFGYLKNTAIDQHLLARNRQFDMLEIIEARPELLGIGLDEDTAILVDGDRFQVLGRGYVAIYDGEAMDGRPFYLLREGDRFDLATRVPSRPGSTFDAMPGVGRQSGGER